MFCDLRYFGSAVERVHHYAHNLEQEAPHYVDDKKPLPDWPSRGDLELNDISMYAFYLHLFPLLLEAILIARLFLYLLGVTDLGYLLY
jgi:hypothetical protein